ncbi:hypothetical protein ACW9HW_18110 [Pseudomonas sp. SDO5532_S415]|jgi:hypothetical protein|uniref:hypothetical protein n=1 Tax=Pseudomonas sp. Irchel 3A7 TaxID=2008913 RepID=UPI0011408C22|nr:hypothetical protein [Pseudomonas sp. Irchel 3A7]
MDTTHVISDRAAPSTHAGPAVQLRLSVTGNPNKVRRGNSLTKRPLGDLLDANGKTVPGSGNWTLVSVSPSTPGVTVSNNPGYLNGKIYVPRVTSNMTITARLTPSQYPALAKNYVLQIQVI